MPANGKFHVHPFQSSADYAQVILADSPTAYYRLDDTGTTAHDSSGRALSGKIGSSIAESAPGLIATSTDAAMSFPGLASAAGVVAVPATTLLRPCCVVSFEAWVRFASVPSNQTFVLGYGNDGSSSPLYGLFLSADGKINVTLSLDGGTVNLAAPTPLLPNTTYYVAGTYDVHTARIFVNGSQVATAPAPAGRDFKSNQGAGLTIGNAPALNGPSFKGTIDEVAVYAGRALTATQIANHYAAGTESSGYVDWNTFGYNLQRTGDNPNESTLTASNVSSGLSEKWATPTDLGAAITAQPVLATNVSMNGTPVNVLYVGAENNVFYAINADSGAVLWSNSTFGAPQHTSCLDLPGGQFGITGTATFDRSSGLVYVADASDNVHALSMSTGVEQWRVNILFDPITQSVIGTPAQDHIYSALTFNPSNGLLYAETAAFCDRAPWHGRIVAISTATHQVVAAFLPSRTAPSTSATVYCGGGIWGMGGASIDPLTNDVLVATGNIATTASGCPTNTMGETYPYGDAVVELSPQLNLISYEGATINGVNVKNDSDYGATPMLYSTPNCSAELSTTKNKDGYLYTYGENSSGLTAVQQIQVAKTTDIGDFIGVPAFDPATGLVYVGNPKSTGNYAYGLNAFAQTAGGCKGLTLQWKASVGTTNATDNDNQAPTVANGVVYFTDGIGDQLWAFNDATGVLLWHSGTIIGSPCTSYGSCGVFGAPLVDNRVFVGSFNHKLYAFGP
ncbi:MAG TPA: LamG-like jellyroll fold domain-containing protein [Candidatus Baltobacteraceae bacterium]|jgi:outer membrane protein assembly factor BamB